MRNEPTLDPIFADPKLKRRSPASRQWLMLSHLLILGTVGVLIFLMGNTGPRLPDAVGYLEAARSDAAVSEIVGRYSFVHYLRAFLAIIPDQALAGVVAAASVWWLCVGVWSHLSYRMTGDGLAAFLTCSLFVVNPFLLGMAVDPMPEMLAMALSGFALLAITGDNRRVPHYLVAGVFVGLCLRAKEIAALGTLPILTYLAFCPFQTRKLLVRLSVLIAGIVAGWAVVMILDAVFLRDFFFSTKPATYLKLVKTLGTPYVIEDFTFAEFLTYRNNLPFVSVILLGLLAKLRLQAKLICLGLVASLAIAMSLTLGGGLFGFVSRYGFTVLIPLLPLAGLLLSAFVRSFGEMPDANRKMLLATSMMALALAVLGAVKPRLMFFALPLVLLPALWVVFCEPHRLSAVRFAIMMLLWICLFQGMGMTFVLRQNHKRDVAFWRSISQVQKREGAAGIAIDLTMSVVERRQVARMIRLYCTDEVSLIEPEVQPQGGADLLYIRRADREPTGGANEFAGKKVLTGKSFYLTR